MADSPDFVEREAGRGEEAIISLEICCSCFPQLRKKKCNLSSICLWGNFLLSVTHIGREFSMNLPNS